MRSPRNLRRGFMLVEVLIAGAVLSMLVCAFFGGLTVASKAARENADLLAADALAFDLAWMKFNEDYNALTVGGYEYKKPQMLTAAPALTQHWPNAIASNTVAMASSGINGKIITVSVLWGEDNKRSLERRIFRGSLTRIVKDN